MYVNQCPSCGGQVVEKLVKEVLYGGIHTAFLVIKAGVCLHCGERLYTPELIRKFEEIEAKREQQKTDEFIPLGKSFEISVTEGCKGGSHNTKGHQWNLVS